ncbi:uncharacterized protein KIAA2026 homolog [Seriola dumerili]|uniref:uncharacterized protein KIAA2026 homolog n=1 Tax=Seriola dumerili TaxID=41447 RepID=UPI000BBEBB9C|nr:uncharacterized protein KIAA2026 homolog [Seriola dumerili]
MSSQSKVMSNSTEDPDLVITEEELSNGACEVETMVALHCPGDSGDVTGEGDHLALSNDDMSEFSNSDLSLPEVCISTNSNSFEEDMNYEVQQAYRIFTGFLLDKHKGITSPFLNPIGHQEAQHGIGGVRGRGQAQLRQSMCLRRMEEKFISQEYETITEFVADFRLMLENCYRYHGVDHWISKQAQKLEIMLEQKLTLLSRALREKTTLAVTSKGRFGAEEERGSGGTSTRRRLAPRSLATITVGGHESIMVQTLRLEEQQRAKEEKRQRELEKKEAEEMSAKEVEEWEQTLLSEASPHTVDTLWELPAIGHFLCLAQTALNLPEIVFFELERCLLMPRCSLLLSKIMSSLLSPPQRRATLHRRPALPYRRWESELRQRVMGWYRVVGASHDQPGRAEQLGLCHQFFSTLGEVSPLEEKPFHSLPFYQRVWLLKGLCDHVYETQKGVQDAVLAQPIHECRESVLGYDSKENAYIHFPHFCGADLRIYCQSPSTPPAFPFPSVWESSKKIKDEPSVEPSFKLVCTSLEELRELISKTEDELDDLESTKKRLGRWYYRREAVKDLHSTLIRLLNELSPWEPKLVKAYQRNRLRLKKEFDDFKKHPEYNNFVREECISSSSSDEDEERGLGKEVFSLTDHYRRSEEEDLEHIVPRGLWSGASTRDFVADSAGETTATYVPPIHLKHPLASTEKGVSLLSRVQTGSTNITSTPDSGPQSRSELIPSNQSGESNSAWGAGFPAQTSLSPRPPILHPTTGLPKGYTPIPTLLAKSVGNKVTLMKRPADCPWFNNIDRKSKGSLVSLPTSAVATTKLSNAQSSPSSSQQNSQQMQAQGLQQTHVHSQPGMATVTAAPLKSPQAKPTQAVPKSPVQVVYKVPEGLGHLVRKDSSSPVKISVHPVMNQNTGEKVMQQVVILPSNLLIHKTEEKVSSLHQQQSKGIQVPVSKVASPLCMSTNVPGFTIPENRIPVQQVAPLKDARTMRTPSPSVSPRQQQGTLNAAGFKGSQVCSTQASTPQGVTPNPSPITTPSSAVSTESVKSTDPKQELKTVCIRDSQSILVTTRGGNTGIVKVQTSSDHNALGSLPTSPVITISPQFKAFLVSKTSPTFSPSAPSQTSPCTIPAVTNISVAQPQKQVPSVLKPPSTVTTPMHTAVTGSIPVTGAGSQTAVTVALSQGSNTSTCSTVAAKPGQLAQAAAAGSHFQASLVKNTVVVPSLSTSGVSQVLTQAEVISKSGVKRASTDERSQVTKYILVTPSSSSTSNVALPTGTPSSTKSLPGSRVMFISQPTATSSTTSMGSIPKQTIATGASGQLLNTSLSTQTRKTGKIPGQPIGSGNSEALSKVKNISLPSGVQIQLSGKTTTIGQTIGALSCSPSKSTPVSVSDTGCPASTASGLVLVASSNTITTCSTQLATYASLTTSSHLQGIPSFPMISQTGLSTSTGATLPTGNVIKKDLGMCASGPCSFPAQQTTTVQSSQAQTSTPALVRQHSKIQSGIGEETSSFLASTQVALNKTCTSISSATTTSIPFTTSATGTIQQRIVINTSTPLAAGTQILLNSARFVVPPQGLGPGSHVLIISSPAPQQVPSTSATSIGASLPSHGASNVTVAPRAPVLPQSPARLSGVPAASSPFVACTPAVGPSLLATTPSVTPVQLTGTPGQGSTLLPSKTNVVSALPRLPAVHACPFASPHVGTPTLVSSPPRLGSVPALLSPEVTTAPAFGPALAAIRLAVGTPRQAECSSNILPAVANPLPRLSAPLSSLPVLPSPSAVSLPSPVIPVPTPLSAAGPLVAGTPLHSSPSAQQVLSVTTPGPGIQPQQTAVRIAAPSTALSQVLLPSGLGNTSVKKQLPAGMQPVLAGTRTQVLPTVAVPPIVSAVSRMQTLPIATVPPIGSTVNAFETAPVVTTPPSSTTVIITPAQPITSLKTNNTIHPPVILTNQALGKHSLQTSALGMHTNVASKLLISPDGAVLSTAQCQVNPVELNACPKPLDALVVSPNSSTGALHTHDSSLQPSQANTK